METPRGSFSGRRFSSSLSLLNLLSETDSRSVIGSMSVSPTSLFTGFSLVVSDEPVLRDQFYNGNVKTERGELISNPKAVGHFFTFCLVVYRSCCSPVSPVVVSNWISGNPV